MDAKGGRPMRDGPPAKLRDAGHDEVSPRLGCSHSVTSTHACGSECDNGAYANVPWTVSDAANEVEWCVVGGIVFVHIGGYATPNGKVVTGPPLGYYSRHGGYFPCFYYTSNNVMGAWVPPRKDNSRGIYVYGLGAAVGCLLSLNMSWPLYD